MHHVRLAAPVESAMELPMGKREIMQQTLQQEAAQKRDMLTLAGERNDRC
jgi:hypothetical protein